MSPNKCLVVMAAAIFQGVVGGALAQEAKPSIALPAGLSYTAEATVETVVKGGAPISRKGMPEWMKAQIPEGTPSFRGEFSVETTRIKIPEIQFSADFQREWIKNLPQTPDSETILWGIWVDAAKNNIALAVQKDSKLWLYEYQKKGGDWAKKVEEALFEITSADRIKRVRFIPVEAEQFGGELSVFPPDSVIVLLEGSPRSKGSISRFAWELAARKRRPRPSALHRQGHRGQTPLADVSMQTRSVSCGREM